MYALCIAAYICFWKYFYLELVFVLLLLVLAPPLLLLLLVLLQCLLFVVYDCVGNTIPQFLNSSLPEFHIENEIVFTVCICLSYVCG